MRAGLSGYLKSAQTRVALEKSDIGRAILEEFDERIEANDSDGEAKLTLQDRSEAALESFLGRSSFWRIRGEARGQISLFLYKLRNTVFGIRASSRRSMIPGPYVRNMKALHAITDHALESEVSIFIYVAPIRSDVDLLYVSAEYDEFKESVERVCLGKKIRFSNLESIIPGDLWGYQAPTSFGQKERNYDFMHFQAQGHGILADALIRILNDDL